MRWLHVRFYGGEYYMRQHPTLYPRTKFPWLYVTPGELVARDAAVPPVAMMLGKPTAASLKSGLMKKFNIDADTYEYLKHYGLAHASPDFCAVSS